MKYHKAVDLLIESELILEDAYIFQYLAKIDKTHLISDYQY